MTERMSIERILELIEIIWNAAPDLRFGQLLGYFPLPLIYEKDEETGGYSNRLDFTISNEKAIEEMLSKIETHLDDMQ